MQDLQVEFARFVAGSISREQFYRACSEFLEAHPEQRNQAVLWFQNGVQTGRVAPAVWDSIADLFSTPTRPRGTDITKVSTRVPDRPPEHRNEAAAPEPAGPSIGTVLNKRYRLVEELGRGGMGQVFKAVDRNLERAGDPNPFVALKALNAKFARDVDARDALQFEAMRAKTLSHENIIRVHDFDWDGSYVFITMEYLRGAPLDHLIETEYASGVGLAKAWPIIESIGNALEYGHRKGVIHSDVKPGNVFITRKGVVKVLDFGISRPMAKSAASEFDTIYDPVTPIAGLTPSYASLEQWTGEPPDPRDDIYSFSLVIYELLSGHHPFASVSAKKAFESGLAPQRLDGLSRIQWETLRHGLAFQREQRIKSVKELLRALVPPTFFRRYRTFILGGGAAAAALALASGTYFFAEYVQHKTLSTRSHAQHAPVTLTPEQKKDVADSLFLAQDYMKDVKSTGGPNELAYALSEGANNVNQILDSILAIDPDNEQALGMKSRIADIYLAKARELFDKSQYQPALMMVRYGLKAVPDNLDLFHLQQDICDKDASVCAAN
jgi:serine/threonine protein kinase